MISSRLDITNTILVSDNNSSSLKDVDNDTAKFFIKAPNTNLLNFILAKKSILVEGDAEYILMSNFYEKVNNSNEISDSITIISCGGKTFKRYLNLAKILKNKVAVITDNDHDYTVNIENNFSDMNDFDNIRIFSDNNDDRYTFEVCLFKDNEELLKEHLESKAMTNGLLNFMLNNKAESALRVLKLLENELDLIIPEYIVEALQWIKK